MSANVHVLPDHLHGLLRRLARALIPVFNDGYHGAGSGLERRALFAQGGKMRGDSRASPALAIHAATLRRCALLVRKRCFFGRSKFLPVRVNQTNLGTPRIVAALALGIRERGPDLPVDL